MRWPTRDGVIPAHVFFLLERRLVNVAAAEQAQLYYATLLSESMVHGAQEGAAQRDVAVKALRDLAYPES